MPAGAPPTQRPGETPDDYRRRWAAWWEGKTGEAVPEVEQGARPAGQMPGGGKTAAHQPGALPPPDINDTTYDLIDDYDNVIGRNWTKYYTDYEVWQGLTEGPEPAEAPQWRPGEREIMERGPEWRPGERELEKESLEQSAEAAEASNMVDYLEAIAKGIELDLLAGNLELDQAAEEFDRRLEAFAEAGNQMAAMWQWTVPKGSEGKPLHADIRGGLGMQPWISAPEEFDPYGAAQGIVEDMPPMSPVPSTDPYDEAVQAAEGLLG